jgi:hypothetical protein
VRLIFEFFGSVKLAMGAHPLRCVSPV